MRFSIAALLFFCVAVFAPQSAASAAVAAEPDSLSLKKGDRVRVTFAGIKAVCIIEEIQSGILVLRSSESGALQRVRIADISSLEIRAPRSPGAGAARGALIGCGVGFLAGGVYGIAVAGAFGASAGETAELGAAGGFGFLFVGAVLGALGGLAVPGERWESIPLDARLDAGASPNGTIGVGIAIPIGGS